MSDFVQINIHGDDRKHFDLIREYEHRGVSDTFRIIVNEAIWARKIQSELKCRPIGAQGPVQEVDDE